MWFTNRLTQYARSEREIVSQSIPFDWKEKLFVQWVNGGLTLWRFGIVDTWSAAINTRNLHNERSDTLGIAIKYFRASWQQRIQVIWGEQHFSSPSLPLLRSVELLTELHALFTKKKKRTDKDHFRLNNREVSSEYKNILFLIYY